MNWWQVGLYVGPPLFFLLLGLVAGGTIERRHFRSLDEREAENDDVMVSQIRSFPFATNTIERPPKILVAEVVVSSDYLKSFLASFRNIFGGEVKSLQTLLTRSRREALLRLVEQARSEGYNAICNVRFDTADVGGQGKQKAHMSSVMASATAYVAER